MKKYIFTEEAPAPIGPYSQAVLAGDTLYCSGQIAADCLNGGIQEQTDRICNNIAAVLRAAGTEMKDVVKTTCYLTDMKYFTEFNAVYETYFPHKPARTCIAVRDLPKGALAEVDVTAVKT